MGQAKWWGWGDEAISFTHADMNQGRFCGHCHGGGEAPAIPTYRCERCHVAR